jgi:hypothetical protein
MQTLGKPRAHTEPTPASAALRIAAGHLAVSMPLPMSAQMFGLALQAAATGSHADIAIQLFLQEAEPETLLDLVAAGETDVLTLAQLARRLLSPDHPNRQYLDAFPA